MMKQFTEMMESLGLAVERGTFLLKRHQKCAEINLIA